MCIYATICYSENTMKTKVALVKTADRSAGIVRVIDLLGINPVRGKEVLLKPNFNTADPYPGSTHNDTLKHLALKLMEMGASGITVADRSGPADTGEVMRKKGVFELCEELGVKVVNFEDLPAHDWVRVKPEGCHWRNGFDVARPVMEAECVVSTCCLKTHGFGGIFTMSLKLSVGVTNKKNMYELHTSFRSMRKMIAEINQAYRPSLVLLDGIEAFIDGGPMEGVRRKTEVLLAGSDRIAVDAVGLAVLKKAGSNRAVMEKKIFEQEQIARAVELGLGVGAPEDIVIVTDDAASEGYADQLSEILMKG
jgi:uncharacterized protein (DUF362 family)